MTSATGNKGFTFVEVMVAVSLLALGALVIHGGLLRAADLFGRYLNGLRLEQQMDEALWGARVATVYSDSPELGSQSGQWMIGGRSFDWTLSTQDSSGRSQLFEARLSVAWHESGRPLTRQRRVLWSKSHMVL